MEVKFDVDEILDDLLKRAARAGMNRGDLCRRASISESTLTRWRQHKSSPTLSKIEDLERAVVQAQKVIDQAQAS